MCVGLVDHGFAQQLEFTSSYVEVCISILDHRTHAEAAFGPEQEPGAGKSVIVHAVASAPCVLLVAALNQADGQLACDWRPQYRTLGDAWEEVTLPEKAGSWQWQRRAEPFYFYVLAVAPDSVLVSEIERLVVAMQQNGEPVGVLRLQTNKLRGLITQATGDSDPGKHRATTAPTEVSGLTRGTNGFLWRNFASAVHFDNRNSGLLVFEVRSSEP
jgi:hypothetical protein